MSKSIRQQAEERQKKNTLQNKNLEFTKMDMMKNIHELELYQIELEIQNEELQHSRLLEQEALERYSDFYEFAPTGFMSLNRDGIIHQINTTGSHLLGLEKSSLLNCRFGIFVEEISRPVFNSFFEEVFLTGVTQSCELKILNESHSSSIIVQFEGKLSPNKKECRVILVDMTGRKKVEKTLNEQQLQLYSYAKFAALGEMASGIAHEINNPLTVIMMKSYLIREYLSASPINVSEIVVELENIELTIARITNIIKGLKSFSRNSDNASLVEIKLSQILEDTLSLCQEKIKHQQIHLTISHYVDVPLKCKPTFLSQVIINLLSNSVDAIQNLDKKWIDIQISSTEKNLMIKITDSGAGISKEVVDKIMQPFFTTKDLDKGTGLGLSISKGIIEEMKGQLYYELSQGYTCFVIKLPI